MHVKVLAFSAALFMALQWWMERVIFKNILYYHYAVG